jgi:hypothetical protein
MQQSVTLFSSFRSSHLASRPLLAPWSASEA